MTDIQPHNLLMLLVDRDALETAATQIQTLILFFAQINVFHDYYMDTRHRNIFMIKIAVAIGSVNYIYL